MYMKLLFSFIFLFITFESLEAKKVRENYTVKTKGITIGNLDWQVKLEKDTYTTIINLKNKGPFSLVYKFKGYYEASGIIKNDICNPYTGRCIKVDSTTAFVEMSDPVKTPAKFIFQTVRYSLTNTVAELTNTLYTGLFVTETNDH